MTNDLPPGTSFGPMSFDGISSVRGNPMTLTGNVYRIIAYADLKLGSSVVLSGTVNGAIDINGQTLFVQHAWFLGPINGDGTIISETGSPPNITLLGSGNFSGTIRGGQYGGALLLEAGASLPNATVAIEMVVQFGSGATLGDLTIKAQNLTSVAPGDDSVLYVRSLTLSPPSIGANGGGVSASMDPTGNSQIDVMGAVALNGALLWISPSGTLVPGQSFMIIKNDGTGPVSGTFADLPEGTVLGSGSYRFRISYVGGDGNDVVLTTLANTITEVSQSAGDTQFGEPLTVTATVAAQSGTPTGSVVFTADGATIGTAPVQNGVAALTLTTLNSGTHAIVATFLGTGLFVDSVSGSTAHVITHGQTKTNIAPNQPDILYGQAARFTVTVGVQAPAAGQPTGSVTVLADGAPLGTAPVVNGTATFDTAALHTGVRSITATYGGDTNFDGSTASAIQQNVGKAQTAIDARPRTPLLVGEMPFITVFVNVAPGAAVVPTGAVSITEGGTNLGTQALIGGVATFTLNPLAVGDHTLVLNYSGDTDFEASSATIIQSVVVPAISIQGTRTIQGNRGVASVSLMVSLSAPISQTVRVSFSTVAGSATEGEDYESASGVIEFAPGELTKAIEIHILGDALPEGDETFSVLLSDPVNATIDTPSAVVVIVNNNPVPPRRRAARH
ncbi:MAG TPA: Ig-like domain repeat protein [Thermoanaerobaculia bacterium]|nr:Ig-like domain repeat protein [Thermoanaerobaculia bacterium]